MKEEIIDLIQQCEDPEKIKIIYRFIKRFLNID